MKFKIKYNKGFTLIELLAAVTIVGVIATLALPRYRSMLARARTAEAKTNLSVLNSLQKEYRYIDYAEDPSPYKDKKTGFHKGLHYGLDKCSDSATESRNDLGFRLSDCTKSRYRYMTNLGNDCAKSDGSIAQGQVYPNCNADDVWSIDIGAQLKHVKSAIDQCPDGTGSAPSSSCSAVAVAVPTITTPTPIPTISTPAPTTTPSITPTSSPSPTPTVTSSPSPTPTISVSPSPTITPTPTCKASCAAGCTSWTHDRYSAWTSSIGCHGRQEIRKKHERRSCSNLCSVLNCPLARDIPQSRCPAPSPTPSPSASSTSSAPSHNMPCPTIEYCGTPRSQCFGDTCFPAGSQVSCGSWSSFRWTGRYNYQYTSGRCWRYEVHERSISCSGHCRNQGCPYTETSRKSVSPTIVSHSNCP